MAYKRISPQPVIEGGTGLTTITNFNLLAGNSTSAPTLIAPSSTSGVPLISQGSSSNPLYGTAVVAGGGTGDTSFTTYAPVCGGTTTTGALQSASTGLSSSGFVLTSTGSTSLPTFQAVPASSITITGNSGGGLTGNAFTFTGGSTGLTFAGTTSPNTETITGTLVVSNGGTGDTTFTTYAPVCGGITSTGSLQSASTGISNSGYILTSTGATSLPTFQAPAASSITVTGNSGGALTGNAFTFTGGTTGLTFAGTTSPNTETITGTLVVSNGGTGDTTFTTYAPVCGGTTATGALQSASTGISSSGFVLTSTGSTSLPTFQAVPASSITITGNSGGGLTGNSFTFTGGTTGLTFAGTSSPNTETITGTLVVSNGGTGDTTFTTYAPVCGGTTTTGALQSASSGISNTGYVLTSTGSTSLPTWQAAPVSFTWNNATSSTQAMAVNNGYISNYTGGLLTFTLPSTAAVGSVLAVAGNNTGGWKIAQNASQLIHFGNVTTTTGTGGSLSSSLQYDSVQMICTVANTTFVVLSSIGNLTYV